MTAFTLLPQLVSIGGFRRCCSSLNLDPLTRVGCLSQPSTLQSLSIAMVVAFLVPSARYAKNVLLAGKFDLERTEVESLT